WPLVRFDDHVGDLSIERIADFHQIAQHLARLRILQQRPIAIPGRALQLLLDRGMQVYDPPPGPQRLAILRPQHHAAAGSDHHAFELAELRDHRLFTLAKTLLALDIEDPGDIGTGTLLDFLVRILEVQLQLFGQQPPDGALSSTHRADQDYVLHYQLLIAMAWLFMMRGVMKTSSSFFVSFTTSRRKIRPTKGTSPRN